MSAAKVGIVELGADCLLVGMAIGFDLAVAMAAYELGVPFVACIPFRGQEGRWSAREQARWAGALERSFGAVVVSPGGFTGGKMIVRNEMMVENSTGGLLALWDGTGGGTSHTVGVAGRRGVVVRNVWPDYRAGSADLFE